MLRPSKIVAEALGLEPLGLDIANQDTTCCMCGSPIKEGEPVCWGPLQGAPNFTDEFLMASRSNVSCQWCSRFVKKGYSKKPLFAAANKVHTKEGSFEINTDACRVWFFLTPPEPPYVAVLNEGMNAQHHAWCAPVTLDNEQMEIKYGKTFMTIRHSRLLKAIEYCREAADILNNHDYGKKKYTPVTHPYRVLDRNMVNLEHGRFLARAEMIAAVNPRMAEILEFLKNNTLGETWALSSIVKKKQETPDKKGPVTI